MCSNGEVRLQGGNSLRHGRVEICFDAVWGSICDTLWDDNEATVVCRQLGFSDQGNNVWLVLITTQVIAVVHVCRSNGTEQDVFR